MTTLPDILEVQPLAKPPNCKVTVSRSTSATNRAPLLVVFEAQEHEDCFTVSPAEAAQLLGAEAETGTDHGMVMCFSSSGLKVPGIRFKNRERVSEMLSNFSQKLEQLRA